MLMAGVFTDHPSEVQREQALERMAQAAVEASVREVVKGCFREAFPWSFSLRLKSHFMIVAITAEG